MEVAVNKGGAAELQGDGKKPPRVAPVAAPQSDSVQIRLSPQTRLVLIKPASLPDLLLSKLSITAHLPWNATACESTSSGSTKRPLTMNDW
jgi:hypothetical protein